MASVYRTSVPWPRFRVYVSRGHARNLILHPDPFFLYGALNLFVWLGLVFGFFIASYFFPNPEKRDPARDLKDLL